MNFEVKEGLLVDLGLGSDSRDGNESEIPLNLKTTFESDVSSTRSKVSSILCSSAKRLEDDDDPFGILTTPSASKKVRKIPDVELGVLIKISDEKSENSQNGDAHENISEILPPFLSLDFSNFSDEVFGSDKKSNQMDKTADSTDWQRLQLEAEAIASTMKSTKKTSRLDKRLDLGQFSPLNPDNSPLNLVKDEAINLVSPPKKVLDFDFSEEFIKKKLSPEIMFADEDESDDAGSGGVFLDDQLEKVIRRSLEGLKISEESEKFEKENVQSPEAGKSEKPLIVKNPKEKPVAAVVPSVKRKPLVSVAENKREKAKGVPTRAHGGIPLPPPKKGQKPLPVRAKVSALPNKGFSTPKAPKPVVRKSIAVAPDTPRPDSKFVTPAQPLKPRRSLIQGVRPPVYASTPIVSTTPSKSSCNVPTSARRSISTPKSFIPTTPNSSSRKPVSRLPPSVMRYSSSSTPKEVSRTATTASSFSTPKKASRTTTTGLKRPSMSFGSSMKC